MKKSEKTLWCGGDMIYEDLTEIVETDNALKKPNIIEKKWAAVLDLLP